MKPLDHPARRPCKACGHLVSRYDEACPACRQALPGVHVACPRCGSLHVDFYAGSPFAGRPPGREPVEATCRDCGLTWTPTMDEVLDATFGEHEARERTEFRDLVERHAKQILDASDEDSPSPRPAPRSGCGGCLAAVLIPVGIVTAFAEPVVGLALLALGIAPLAARRD